jgi:hypothetical protein
MTPEEQERNLKTAYVLMAAYYQHLLTDEVLCMYVQDLADLPYDAVVEAMQRIRREAGRRFCPLPGDIRALVEAKASPAGEANEIAGRILTAMTRYGYTQPARAEAFIGDIGWSVVQLQGGWRHICNTLLADDSRTFFAQCRDVARSLLEKPVAQRPARQEPKQLEGRRDAGALPARPAAAGAVAADLLRTLSPTP